LCGRIQSHAFKSDLRQSEDAGVRTLAAAVLLGLAVTPAVAEIEKLAVPGDEGLCFYWWPKLPVLAGWQQDREQSFNYSANALAPEGSTFADAETVMYARAIYKPREPETKSVEQLIENDRRDFGAHSPGIVIREAPLLVTADGQRLRSFSFVPKSAGNRERVSYGEEGDFYLIFTISSRSLDGYNASMPAYEQLIKRYRSAPAATPPQAPARIEQ